MGTSHGQKLIPAGSKGGKPIVVKGAASKVEPYAISGRVGGHFDQIILGFGPKEADPNSKCKITSSKAKANAGQKIAVSWSNCYEAPDGRGWLRLIRNQVGVAWTSAKDLVYQVVKCPWKSGFYSSCKI